MPALNITDIKISVIEIALAYFGLAMNAAIKSMTIHDVTVMMAKSHP